MSNEKLLRNTKALRTNQTDAEHKLWRELRAHRFMGLKFKRQVPLGRYIVDFVCIEHQLVIEIDGGQHTDQVDYDSRRETWLRSQGYTVLRYWNNEVLQQLDGVLEQIRSAIPEARISP
jgi:very-short-patch-repair endonuclease